SASGQVDMGGGDSRSQPRTLAGDRSIRGAIRRCRSDAASEFDGGPTAFERFQEPGRVDLTRRGNTIEAATRGVAAFTLLRSPEKFDFDHPITVTANGRTVFDGRVQRDLKTLLKWAARDNDRSMLYGAELKI